MVVWYAAELTRVIGRSREFVRISEEGEPRTYNFRPECVRPSSTGWEWGLWD